MLYVVNFGRVLAMNFKLKNLTYCYDITLNSKFTIISGDSGVGKTNLVSLANLYKEQVLGVTCTPTLNIETNIDDLIDIKKHTNTLFILDEDSKIFRDALFFEKAKQLMKQSDNLYIFITRKKLNLPVPENSYMCLSYEPKTRINRTVLIKNKLHNELNISNKFLTIIEDSKSGYLFIKEYYEKYKIEQTIVTAKGIGNLAAKIEECISKGNRHFNVIYDYFGSGQFIQHIMYIINKYPTCEFNIIDWLCFEHYLLCSNNLKSLLSENTEKLKNVYLNNAEEFCERLLSSNLHYSKRAFEKSCFTLKSICKACPDYQVCNYSVNDRADNYTHSYLSPLKKANDSTVRETDLFSKPAF